MDVKKKILLNANNKYRCRLWLNTVAMAIQNHDNEK